VISELVRKLASTGRARKRSIIVGYDFTAMVLALWVAFCARLGQLYIPAEPAVLLAAFGSFAFGLIALNRLGIYRIVLRYFEMRATSRIFAGAAVAAIMWVMLVYFTQARIRVDGIEMLVPRSVGVIYCGFLVLLLFAGRYAMAIVVLGAMSDDPVARRGRSRNVGIYGANAAGISLAESMRSSLEYRLRLFVDDDPTLHGRMVAGVQICSPKALPELAASGAIDEIFLAMPKASRSQRLAAISRVTKLDLKVMTVPAPEEIVSGRFAVTDVRPIDVNDLLRRDTVEPLAGLIQKAVEGHSILITGAGGSIGSEICRQILRARPHKMVLLDHSEFNLYAIEQQLNELCPARERPELISIIGSVTNETLIRTILESHGIDTVYHAAAYKHVPLLESNEIICVENNVFGTFYLAQAAAEARIARLTMISTDKAVRPTSVMGASKRAAELVIQAFAHQAGCQTQFGIVRFGNVLDSSGSVVQRFRKQIREGGPVTVTHPDITRFFMSIPEATQLVLQAGAMAQRGEVFVLEMGEPIRIADLARNMVSLSGLTVRDENNPEGDVEMVYVGLRPGEKLHEELFVGPNSLPTAHERIRMANERYLPMAILLAHLDELKKAIEIGDAIAVRTILQQLAEPDQAKAVGNVEWLRRA